MTFKTTAKLCGIIALAVAFSGDVDAPWMFAFAALGGFLFASGDAQS